MIRYFQTNESAALVTYQVFVGSSFSACKQVCAVLVDFTNAGLNALVHVPNIKQTKLKH